MRFALRERADGTWVCVIRTGHRYYEFEWRDTDGAWWELRDIYYVSSMEEAIRRVAELACYDNERWASVSRDKIPTRRPL
jgi:hypothetical protein